MKIMMVCLGNICRSPMADGLMRKKVAEHQLDIVIESAGTGGWHVDDSPDERMQKTGEENGVPIAHLRGRQFKTSDFDEFDRIYVMDQSNYANVVQLARNVEDKNKIGLMLNGLHPGSDMEVPDPYFGGNDGFQRVFEMLDDATDVLMKELKGNG